VVAFLWHSDMGSQTFVGDELPQQEAQSFIDLIYETADGYITVAVQTDRQWQALTRALQRPAWLDDDASGPRPCASRTSTSASR
jgi:crotonobetainyl-CoA:carnitine CoA-transferase CaiB-like acyl-CoA transferase